MPKPSFKPAPLLFMSVAMTMPLVLGGCYDKPEQKGRDMGPAAVGYVVAAYDTAPVSNELSGRVAAFEVAEIRPQASGLIEKRLFAEGAFVRQGQALYRLNSAGSEAAAAQAEANLAAARANRAATAAKAERYRPLAEMEAVSKQDYADAAAASQLARAQVAQQEAALRSARVTLGYATIVAPISGRIGRSMVTTGALVTANQATPLATVQKIDPVYVDLQQSSTQMLALRKALAGHGAAPAKVGVELLLEDGSVYPYAGSLQLTEQVVDPTTGAVTLRASFPNPRSLLLPGMFVRARVAQGTIANVVRVPQQALQRDPKGQGFVYVVNAKNQAERVDVTTARTIGGDWIVTAGIAPGMKIITQGLAQVQPGKSVKAQPARPLPAPVALPGQSVAPAATSR